MWDPAGTTTHFADTKRELFLQTSAFHGQVLLVNGDSHHFVVDKPLTDYATTNAAGLSGANLVQNFTRSPASERTDPDRLLPLLHATQEVAGQLDLLEQAGCGGSSPRRSPPGSRSAPNWRTP